MTISLRFLCASTDEEMMESYPHCHGRGSCLLIRKKSEHILSRQHHDLEELAVTIHAWRRPERGGRRCLAVNAPPVVDTRLLLTLFTVLDAFTR